MNKYIMTLAALFAFTGVALAGYDIDKRNILDVTSFGIGDTAETDYLHVYSVTDTTFGTGEGYKLPLNYAVPMVEALTAADTLTTADCGKTLLLNSATEFATTLPSPTSGCKIRIVVKAAPASASYTVVTGSSANILIGGINELEVDTGDDGPYDADGDTITFVNSVAVVGDFVELISDGTSWYLHGQANADGGITITKAS